MASIAMLAFAPGPAPADATLPVRVRAEIRAIAHAVGVRYPDHIDLSTADIARGYVDVLDATALVLTSNSPWGYSLAAAFDSTVVSRVVVRIHGQEVEFAQNGMPRPVRAPRMIGQRLRVDYRLYLAPGAAPGPHVWPVAISFLPGDLEP